MAPPLVPVTGPDTLAAVSPDTDPVRVLPDPLLAPLGRDSADPADPAPLT
jgi:hypothetical protein